MADGVCKRLNTPDPITDILQSISAGKPGAQAQLLNALYDELHRIATAKMAQESKDHTLQPTALINEAYPRLLGDVRVAWKDRQHFLGAAAEAMRRVLIDHARTKKRIKRGGTSAKRVQLTDALVATSSSPDELLELDAALCRLEAIDPVRASVVKLKFFAGLTHAEIADTLNLPLRTTERHWTFARAWLRNEMSQAQDLPPTTGNSSATNRD